MPTMPTEIRAAYLEYRENDLLDAVVTAAALMARADGSLQLVERHRVVDVLADEGFLFVFTRKEILEAFERKLSDLRTASGPSAGVEQLKRFAGRPLSDFVIAVAEQIAAADCRVDRCEQRMLKLVRTALGRPFSTAVPARTRAGASE
jgi:tellurite resistance protein